jgi:hypothetical protein
MNVCWSSSRRPSLRRSASGRLTGQRRSRALIPRCLKWPIVELGTSRSIGRRRSSSSRNSTPARQRTRRCIARLQRPELSPGCRATRPWKWHSQVSSAPRPDTLGKTHRVRRNEHCVDAGRPVRAPRDLSPRTHDAPDHRRPGRIAGSLICFGVGYEPSAWSCDPRPTEDDRCSEPW